MTRGEEPSWEKIGFDFYCDTMFFFDVLLTFITPYFEKDGKYVRDNKRISKRYTRSWFFPELIACFPFTYFRKVSSVIPNQSKYFNNIFFIILL